MSTYGFCFQNLGPPLSYFWRGQASLGLFPARPHASLSRTLPASIPEWPLADHRRRKTLPTLEVTWPTSEPVP